MDGSSADGDGHRQGRPRSRSNTARLQRGLVRRIVDQRRREDQLRHEILVREEHLSTAAHELRTPLTALLFQLGHLRRELALQPAARQVQRCIRQADRVTDLVTSLLDAHRLERGPLELDAHEIDLVELVGDVVERFDAMATEAGCELSIDAAGPTCGHWDRSRIEQVVTNLLSNAIKYGRGAPVVIVVRAGGERARISVTDQGIGIHPEETGRIFERFERTENARGYEGLGLGLYIARRIVEAHEGSIGVASAPGCGATFTVELPVARAR